MIFFSVFSSDEEDTGDSLDIKPPQAKMSESYNKYKEKKAKSKHSRGEHKRNKERERDSRGHPKERGMSDHHRHRYKNKHEKYEETKYYYRDNYKSHSKHKTSASREHSHSRRNSPPPPTSYDKLQEDLRKRLIKKKLKEQQEAANNQENDYYHEPGKKSRSDYYFKEKREKEDPVEVDSPTMEQQYVSSKPSKERTKEYEEKEMRRRKLLEAEREMAKQKEKAREELEQRREQRRNRSPTPSPKKRKYDSPPEPKKSKNHKDKSKSKDEDVVMVSDHSEKEDEEIEEEEEEDDSESDSSTNSERSKSEEKDVPSPLSVGHLSKSPRHKHKRSHTRSRSRSVSRSLSRSPSRDSRESRDDSRSRSRSHSKSRDSKSPRSRSGTKSRGSSAEKEKTKNPETSPEAGTSVKVEEIIEELPSYFPAIQGCRSVEEFQCLNRIEEGTYGVVYRAKDKRTEEIVALKRLKMEKEKEGFPITSLREINTLLKGQHPNIVTVREIVVGSNMDKIFIVMDYVEHDLKSLMETMKHKKQVFLPGEVKCLTQQLLKAVAHLHDNWILHRDLKTSNLLLSHKGILKVGDFGLAREYGSPLKPYTSVVVTLWYRAPELLLGIKEYSTPIDVWSCGCIFAELLAMTALFPGKSEIDQLNRIFKDLGTPNERIWPGYTQLPLVNKTTFIDSPVSLLRKKFSHLTSELGLSLLQGLLTYDPKQRLTAETALKNSYFKELPLPIDACMFPTWPAKSELGLKKALASSPKPPSGGGEFKKLVRGLLILNSFSFYTNLIYFLLNFRVLTMALKTQDSLYRERAMPPIQRADN